MKWWKKKEMNPHHMPSNMCKTRYCWIGKYTLKQTISILFCVHNYNFSEQILISYYTNSHFTPQYKKANCTLRQSYMYKHLLKINNKYTDNTYVEQITEEKYKENINTYSNTFIYVEISKYLN